MTLEHVLTGRYLMPTQVCYSRGTDPRSLCTLSCAKSVLCTADVALEYVRREATGGVTLVSCGQFITERVNRSGCHKCVDATQLVAFDCCIYQWELQRCVV